jgi:hypothetical protein
MKSDIKVVWLAVVLCFSTIAALCIDAVRQHVEVETKTPATWAPPDVSTCPADVELWECIRHAMYREDT